LPCVDLATIHLLLSKVSKDGIDVPIITTLGHWTGLLDRTTELTFGPKTALKRMGF